MEREASQSSQDDRKVGEATEEHDTSHNLGVGVFEEGIRPMQPSMWTGRQDTSSHSTDSPWPHAYEGEGSLGGGGSLGTSQFFSHQRRNLFRSGILQLKEVMARNDIGPTFEDETSLHNFWRPPPTG